MSECTAQVLQPGINFSMQNYIKPTSLPIHKKKAMTVSKRKVKKIVKKTVC
jgi:hypothetical protein